MLISRPAEPQLCSTSRAVVLSAVTSLSGGQRLTTTTVTEGPLVIHEHTYAHTVSARKEVISEQHHTATHCKHGKSQFDTKAS